MRNYGKLALAVTVGSALLFCVVALNRGVPIIAETTSPVMEARRMRSSEMKDVPLRHAVSPRPAGAGNEVEIDSKQPSDSPKRTVDLTASKSPDDVVALQRHLAIRHYLASSARDTAEARAVAEICRQFGFGAWAFVASYDIAWESKVTREVLEQAANRGVPSDAFERLAHSRKCVQEERIEMFEAKLGAKFPDDMIRRLSEIEPTAFLGQPPIAIKGEDMLDQMGWDDPKLTVR